MKKSLSIICLVAVFAMLAASCAQHNTCPAYRGSVAMVAEE